MDAKKYKVLGVMSGTSLDGIDCAVIEFELKDNQWSFDIIFGETLKYSNEWIRSLQSAIYLSNSELDLLNENYTDYLGEILQNFLLKNNLNDLDFISSHGHTILHRPNDGFTLQIGNLPAIKKYFSIPFICDFRVQDVKLGGQGAPLVPIGDELLFTNYTSCLNLGGFSNVSFNSEGKRLAYDICPINTLLNYFSLKLGYEYDDQGKLAKSGFINETLLNELSTISYYKQKGPKSLGMEQVNSIYLPIIAKYNLETPSILATLVEHMAQQIALVLNKITGVTLVTGGGAHNMYLIDRIKFYLKNTTLEIGSKELIEFKEALIFAFLGVLRFTNTVNVLSSVTGARKDHCSGIIFR